MALCSLLVWRPEGFFCRCRWTRRHWKATRNPANPGFLSNHSGLQVIDDSTSLGLIDADIGQLEHRKHTRLATMRTGERFQSYYSAGSACRGLAGILFSRRSPYPVARRLSGASSAPMRHRFRGQFQCRDHDYSEAFPWVQANVSVCVARGFLCLIPFPSVECRPKIHSSEQEGLRPSLILKCVAEGVHLAAGDLDARTRPRFLHRLPRPSQLAGRLPRAGLAHPT